jgi:hypothetical protein
MANQRYNRAYPRRFPLYILLLTVSGCFTTNVSLPIPPEFASGHVLTPLTNTQINWPTPTATVGHQFVLGVIPAGTITTRLLTSSLARSLLSTSLSRETGGIPCKQILPQKITITDISLSGWDLIITRHLSCHLEAEVCYPSGNTPPPGCTHLTAQTSTYHQYAFRPQLRQTLALCLSRLSEKIIGCSGKTSRSEQER